MEKSYEIKIHRLRVLQIICKLKTTTIPKIEKVEKFADFEFSSITPE